MPPDWINVDRQEGPNIDVRCDIILDGLPFQDDSIDYISSQNALPSLEVYYLWPALEELYRVLKVGGALRLGLPDLDKAINAYKNHNRDYFWCWDWDTVSGNFITQATNYGCARTPLNYAFTKELLQKAGFKEVRQVAYHQTSSLHPDIVELDDRPAESFFVEAFKPDHFQKDDKIVPGPASQIHLSWTQDASTSLTIVWHTPLGDHSTVAEYRKLNDETWERVTGVTTPFFGRGTLHRATVTGLRPATAYEYRVAGDEGVVPSMSETFCTRTAPPLGSTGYCFAFLCDIGLIGRLDGNATGTKQIIDEIVSDNPLFVLGGGDYAYANRDGRYGAVGDAIDAWFVQMQPALTRFPFMAQYGNHEIYLHERFRDWAPRFAHPEGFDGGRNYSFDVGDAHFTAFFVPGPSLTGEQLLWLDADLAHARDRGIKWLIVYQHEPIYAHGHSHPARPELRKVLAPILEEHRVDLHLSGHDQNYERTFPLVGVPDNPTPTSSSQDCYEAGRGVIYAKVSPGGKMSEIRDDFSRFTTEQQPFIAMRDDTAHHYALITVGAAGELKVDVYSIVGDGRPRVLLDSFRLVDTA
ncbi:MAG: fibronectin type III domain-containing protein [Actinomycetota bacterium]|nr:fibronectin type III domain-containing protein [Actinomycetota bacterium]